MPQAIMAYHTTHTARTSFDSRTAPTGIIEGGSSDFRKDLLMCPFLFTSMCLTRQCHDTWQAFHSMAIFNIVQYFMISPQHAVGYSSTCAVCPPLTELSRSVLFVMHVKYRSCPARMLAPYFQLFIYFDNIRPLLDYPCEASNVKLQERLAVQDVSHD